MGRGALRQLYDAYGKINGVARQVTDTGRLAAAARPLAQLAELRGRVNQVFDELREDKAQREELRNPARHQSGVRLGLKDGRLTGAPDGWPEGVDPDTFINDWIEERRSSYLSGIPKMDAPSSDMPATGAVKRFREAINGT